MSVLNRRRPALATASLLAICASLGLGRSAGAAEAAETTATAAPGNQLEEVIVEARRVEENLQEVPVAVTAISQQLMTDKAIVTAADFQRVTPGLTANQNPRSDDNVRYTLRGQSSADVTLNTDSSVGVYVDGIYRPRVYGLKISLFDLDRVEVLKGPQGTLYGKNTTGGAINIFTHKAKIDELGGFLYGAVGDYETARLQGAVNVPLVAGKLAARLSLNYDTTEGYGKNRLGARLSDHDAYAARLSFTARPSETFEILGSAGYVRFDGNGPFTHVIQVTPTGSAAIEAGLQLGGFRSIAQAIAAGQTTATLAARGLPYIQQQAASATRFNSGGTRDTSTSFEGADATIQVSWNLGEHTALKSLTGYQRYQRGLSNDLDASNLTIFQTAQGTHDHVFSQEINLTGDLLEGRAKFATGAYYGDEKGREFGFNNILPFLSGNERTVSDLDIRNKSAGAYVQVTFDVTDKLSATGGLRYSEDRRDVVTRSRNLTVTGVTTCQVVRPSPTAPCEYATPVLKSDAVSYTASLAYQFTDDVNFYAVTRKGYRAGGWNPAADAVNPPNAFGPEKVTDYEIGMKSELLDRRVRFNIAGYRSNYSDVQKSTILFTSSGTSIRRTTNAASARVEGVEADLLANVTSHFRVDATLAYTDARYRDFVIRNPTTGAIVENRTTEPFELPKWTYGLGAKYTWELPIGNLSARADWYWIDSVIFSGVAALQPTERILYQPSYGLLGARVEWAVPEKGLTVAVVGSNLANKYYYTAGTDGRSVGYAFVQVGPPRWVGIELRKTFGGE